MSTAVLDPRADEVTTERLWDLGADTLAGAPAAAASLDRWMSLLLQDLEGGGAVACLACGDPSGLRAGAEGGPAACRNCGCTLA